MPTKCSENYIQEGFNMIDFKNTWDKNSTFNGSGMHSDNNKPEFREICSNCGNDLGKHNSYEVPMHCPQKKMPCSKGY